MKKTTLFLTLLMPAILLAPCGGPAVPASTHTPAPAPTNPPPPSATHTPSPATPVTTPAGRQTVTIRNAQGHITQRQVAGILPIQLGYDPQGRLTTISQAPTLQAIALERSKSMILG